MDLIAILIAIIVFFSFMVWVREKRESVRNKKDVKQLIKRLKEIDKSK